MSYRFVMTEHPSWRDVAGVRASVMAADNGDAWFAEVRECAVALRPLTATEAAPRLEVFAMPSGRALTVPDLMTALQSLGPVARFRNPSLWDALATAIVRQVIRAAQAKKLYRAFCEAYGEQVHLPGGGSLARFPAPHTVLGLGEQQFAEVGMAFKRRPLQRAAEAFLATGAGWAQLAPAVLVKELQAVPGIGAWTAGAAVADWSNDWALYPYADLAVRTWATRAAPSQAWPDDEASFARQWRALAGEHLSTFTLLTLAWGSHHGAFG